MKISIIICSREKSISDILSLNISETIGCPYELIIIDNTGNQYSIFEAYNLGIEKSKGEYLCFIHDDILFHTIGWGSVVLRIFESDVKIGLIGVAGAKVKTKMPSAWWDGGENVLKLVQHYKNRPKEFCDQGFNVFDLVDVAVIDGVFMVMRRDERIKFDEKLKGFHNYDVYISLKHHILKKKVVVTSKIFLEHFSEGSLNKAWFESSSQFHKLYKNYLPVVIKEDCKDINLEKKEFTIGASFVMNLIEQKLHWTAIYWWFQVFKLKPIAKFHFRFLKKILEI